MKVTAVEVLEKEMKAFSEGVAQGARLNELRSGGSVSTARVVLPAMTKPLRLVTPAGVEQQ